MSNPYDPYNPSGDQPSDPWNKGDQGQPGQQPGQPGSPSPYGAPPPYGAPSPYGGAPAPYGSPSPYGANQPVKTDALSIVGFILSLTCCLSVFGAILGFIGLGRTKDGARKGRWAAISASIIGVIGTIVLVVAIIGIVFLAKNSISIDDATVGQCMNVSESGSNSVSLRKKDCTSSHDAEIVYVGVKGAIPSNLTPKDINDLSDTGIAQAVCSSLLDPAVSEKLSGDQYEFQIVSNDPNDTSPTSKFVCYVENADSSDLTSDVLK